MTSNILDRLADKFTVGDDCWEWTAGINPSTGYGAFWLDGRTQKAHRVLYELLVGPIPVGLDLDHLCRNRACVNPKHLEPVTRQENLRRSPFTPASRTHCPQGHPYSPENTYTHPRTGGRFCRTCNREKSRRHYHAK